MAPPPLHSPCDGPVTYPGFTKILVKSSKGRSVPTLNTTEASVLKKREEQRLEAAQMKFLRHLHGITKLIKKRITVLDIKREYRT